VAYIVPISISIIILLAIVYISYRQTIMAYPQGGGSYTVASENLGVWPGLLAAASLMVDYVLTAAVGISAGVGALISAVPALEKHTLALCLAILIMVTLVNLRGVSATGGIFLAPTYLFIFCLLAMIALGVIKTLAAGGHPIPVVAPPHLGAATEALGIWLLLRAFASGCTAMTGVEAVSNGVMAFKEPASVTGTLHAYPGNRNSHGRCWPASHSLRRRIASRPRLPARRAIKACSRSYSRPLPAMASSMA